MRLRSWPAALGLAAGALSALVAPVGTGSAAAATAGPATASVAATPTGSTWSAGPGQEPGTTARQPEEPTQLGEPQIELVEQSTWLDEGQAFEARVRITRPPAGATVRIGVHERLLSRVGFQESLGGDLGATELEVPPQAVALLPARGAGTLGVGFATDGSSGASLGEGVYPVEVQVLDASGTAVAGFVTYVVVRPPESPDFPALAVGVVVDVATPPALQPDGTIDISDEALDRVRERVTVLEGTQTVPLTIAPRPETLDGLADLGDGGPELLAELVGARGERPVLARPYTDVDIAALMGVGQIAELNAQADGGANVIRSRFGTEPTPGVWLADGTLGAPAAQMLVELGVGRAVVAPEAVAEVPGVETGPVPTGTITLGEGGPVTMVDDSALTERLTGDDGVLGAQRFVAELAMLWLERPADQRGVVVRIPPDVPLDTQLVETAMVELAESRILSPTTLDGLFSVVPPVEGDAPPVATPAPHQITNDLAAVARRLEGARARVGGYDEAVGDPDAGRSLTDALLLATGADTPDDQRNAYVDRVTGVLNDLGALIRAPREFRITLTSRSGRIPLNLTNDSGQPVNVRIELESDQLEFPGGSVMTATLQPGGNPIDVRVRTRTSGAFPLNIVVTSPDGSIILERTRFDIRSTAVSGVGLVLSIGAGLFLAVWWARHWRSTRRARRLVPTEDIPAVAPPGTPARGLPTVKVPPPPPASPGRPPPPPPADPADPTAGGPTRPIGPTGPGEPPGPPGPGAPTAGPPGPPGPAGAGGTGEDRGTDDDGAPRRKRYRPAHMAGNRSRRR